MRPHIIGLCGRQQTGKTTLARHIIREHGYSEAPLAKPLKAACMALFGLSPEHVDTQRGKAWLHPTVNKTVREILQKLGTEAMRGAFGDDIWCKLWIQRAMHDEQHGQINGWLVPDIRFNNELEFFRNLGAPVVMLRRETSIIDMHASENGIDYNNTGCVDVVINNNSSIQNLCDAFDAWFYEA